MTQNKKPQPQKNKKTSQQNKLAKKSVAFQPGNERRVHTNGNPLFAKKLKV